MERLNIKCFIKGHKIRPYTDSGYDTCERCEAHEYYDGHHCEWNNNWGKWYFTIPSMWHSRKRLFINSYSRLKARFYTRCIECRKVNYILGKPHGDHNQCLPF